MSLLTAPCSWLTPLRRAALCRARTVIEKRSQLLLAQAELLAVAIEVRFDKIGRKRVVARGDWRVGSECQLVRSLSQGSVEGLSGAGRQSLTRELQAQEGRVAFVHVHDLGLRIMRQNRAQGAETTDAQDDLLADTRVLIATVEVAGDPAIVFAVLRQIGIQQVERHPSDLGEPHPREHRPVREGHLDGDWLPVSIQHRLDRHAVGVEHVVGFALVTGLVDDLAEVAEAVEQAHPDERQAKIAGRLQMVPSQHAEAARIDRK
jgi:hypothetical protein